MNRRGFLKLFAGTAAAAVIAPQVSYFFAPKGGWRADIRTAMGCNRACLPRCIEHLHAWQVREAVADFERRTMEAPIYGLDGGSPISLSGLHYHAYGGDLAPAYLGISRAQIEMSGKVGAYQADGGSYFQGQATNPFAAVKHKSTRNLVVADLGPNDARLRELCELITGVTA